ncbi:MAG: hypothetical protein ABW088_02480 [Sedimenticola sp.]
MSDNKEIRNQERSQVPAESATVDRSRRGFAKVGLAAPLLLSIPSRPVFGNVFCTPSALGSATHLSHRPMETSCGGFSPGAWKTPGGDGQDPANEKQRTFLSIFGHLWHGNGSTNNAWFSDTTLQEVLEMGGNQDRYEFGAHAVAAYLNAYYRSTTGYPMTVADVLEMVTAILFNGTYQPVPGYVMDAQDVVRFIEQTFG